MIAREPQEGAHFYLTRNEKAERKAQRKAQRIREKKERREANSSRRAQALFPAIKASLCL